ncbi:MAG: sialate O-acetylesterase [Betaproteobacteria bacterium]|nr:sialate O-acetylesterase [Gammaproteobacteria bacterium]MDH3436656.1 sialate O-acetylesterase [Betaproteobacteria bacterium]
MSISVLALARRVSYRRIWVRFPVLFAALLATASVWARVELAAHIQDQMVVQRGMPWEVSGTANDRERFIVEFRSQRIEVRPAGGAWSVRFDVPSNFTGPAELMVDGGRLEREVLVGDIWLCSGQSNMVLSVARASDGGQMAASSQSKAVHIYQVPKPITGRPPANAGRWIATTSPDQFRRFSAVCLAFGMALHERTKVPVGLIDSSLGGTWIESWISSQSFDNLSLAESARRRYAEIKKRRAATGRRRNTYGIDEPSQLFEFMVRFLARQSIKGVLWYQGEANRRNADQYQELLSVLMKDWRAHWRNSSMPFVIMQLPGFGTPAAGFDANSEWAAVRDAQRRAVASSQPAGLVVSIDFGDGTIHPRTKLPFGRRAADVAVDLAYEPGNRELVPMPTAVSFEDSTATVEFGKGRACLEATPYLSETVFVAGDDHRWHVADVSISQSSLVARSSQVSRPVAVRYAWSDYPRVGLRTCGNGVPVTPFRTDDWRS